MNSHVRWIVPLMISIVYQQSMAEQIVLQDERIALETNQTIEFMTDGRFEVLSSQSDLICQTDLPPLDITLGINGQSGSLIYTPDSGEVFWSVDNAELCFPVDGGQTDWAMTEITLPTGSVMLNNLQSATSIGMYCINNLEEQTEQISFQIIPNQCTTTPIPAANFNAQDPVQVFDSGMFTTVDTSFEGVYGTQWPGIDQSSSEVVVSRNSFLSLAFNSGERCVDSSCTRQFGTIEWVPSVLGNGPLMVSISECPGDFSSNVQSGCLISGSGPLLWTYSSTPESRCNLQDNQNYFLNVIFATPGLTSPTCSSSSCGFLTQVR